MDIRERDDPGDRCRFARRSVACMAGRARRSHGRCEMWV